MANGNALIRVDGYFQDPDGELSYSGTYTNASGTHTIAMVASGGTLFGEVTGWDMATSSLTVRTQETQQNITTSRPAFSISNPANYSQAYAAAAKSSDFPTWVGSDSANNYFYASGLSLFVGGGGDDLAVIDDVELRDFGVNVTGKYGFVGLSMLNWSDSANLPTGVSLQNLSGTSNLTPNSQGLLQLNLVGGGAILTDAETIVLENAAGQTTAAYKLDTTANGLALQLSEGADYIASSGASDRIHAGGGDDIVWTRGSGATAASTNTSQPTVDGGLGDDILLAGDKPSNTSSIHSQASLQGGEGDDLLVALSGTVYASGGNGRDTFAIYGGTRDVSLIISDFNASTDVINLSGLVKFLTQAQTNIAASTAGLDAQATAAKVVSEMLGIVQGQTHSSAVDIDLSAWLDNGHTGKTASVRIEFEAGSDANTALTGHNFVLNDPSWVSSSWRLDLDPLINS